MLPWSRIAKKYLTVADARQALEDKYILSVKDPDNPSNVFVSELTFIIIIIRIMIVNSMC